MGRFKHHWDLQYFDGLFGLLPFVIGGVVHQLTCFVSSLKVFDFNQLNHDLGCRLLVLIVFAESHVGIPIAADHCNNDKKFCKALRILLIL